MTDVQTDHDLKAGLSTMCRRDQHALCKSSGARCTCSCHGSRGQTPPQHIAPPTPIRKEPTMPDTAASAPTPTVPPVKLVQSDPALEDTPGGHICETCGRGFDAAQGLAVHRARKHGERGATKAAPAATPRAPVKAAAPKLDTRSVRESLDDYDPYVLVVGHTTDDGMQAEAVVLASNDEALQVTRLLATLGHPSFVFRLADAR